MGHRCWPVQEGRGGEGRGGGGGGGVHDNKLYRTVRDNRGN